ncbi:MAG: hypothetical protein Kow0031_39720 [Anaerolineae bacterium]
MAREKILIVDDEVDVLDLCRRILLSQGYQITTAHNGFEAIDFAREQQFDLLLTDIKMPGMSGLEIAQQLKEIDQSIVCVTMTGFSTMDMAINALKLGIDEFILKPFTPKDLSAAVSKALEKERLRKENFRLRSLIPLFELNKTLMSTVDETTLLTRVLEIAQQETNAATASIIMFEDGRISESLFLETPALLSGGQQSATLGLGEKLINQQEPLRFNREHPDYGPFLEPLLADSLVVVPLKSQGNVLGLLLLSHKEISFAPSDSEFLSVLCGQASVALDNARLFTKIQDAYQQLQLLDFMKSEFINIAAHELRTPLAILMGYAAILEEEITGDSFPYVANITRNATRLRALIDDMLNLQYLESGIPELSQDTLQLKEVVEQITQDVGLLVEEKQLNIVIDLADNFPPMIADRQKLDLILVNLIHNAVKFTPPGGSITISATPENNRARLSIHNTGSVVPAEKLNQIFERFYQVENSLTREHGGAGLGLAIVRGMVEVCGGKIWVDSSPEQGTTFSFYLPLDNSHLEARKLKL